MPSLTPSRQAFPQGPGPGESPTQKYMLYVGASESLKSYPSKQQKVKKIRTQPNTKSEEN